MSSRDVRIMCRHPNCPPLKANWTLSS